MEVNNYYRIVLITMYVVRLGTKSRCWVFREPFKVVL